MRLARLLLVFAFLTGIFVPALDMVLGMLPTGSTEKRSLAPFPSFGATPARELPARLDAWVRDHFGLRDALIRAANRFRVKALHSSPVKNVILGRDGWLFYAAYGDGADIRDFLGHLPLAPAELAARKQTIEQRAATLAAHGVTYLFVVAPNKQTIYPDKTDLLRGPLRPVTRLDQLAAYLAREPRIPFLDLRATLAAARAERDVYFRTDSHWNFYGGFLAFRAILDRLAALRPDVPHVAASDVEFVDRPASGGDVAALLSMTDDWPDVTQEWEWRGRTVASPLRVVLLGDSFAEYVYPYFELCFAYVNPIEQVQTGGFELDRILAQRPDIVIEHHAERYLTAW